MEGTNEHRPWRTTNVARGSNEEATTTTSYMTANRSRWENNEGRAGRPTERPSTSGFDLPGGRSENMGIHAWHVLLNMRGAMDVPERRDYGVSSTQQDNIRATFEGMTEVERNFMLCSFLRVLALLAVDVATIMENVLAHENPEEIQVEVDEEEGDGTELMERFLKTSPKKGSKERVEEKKEEDKQPEQSTNPHQLFGTSLEMELRTMVSALELSSQYTAMRGPERYWNGSSFAMDRILGRGQECQRVWSW